MEDGWIGDLTGKHRVCTMKSFKNCKDDIIGRFVRCQAGSLDVTTAIVSTLVVVSLAVSLDIYLTSGV